MRLEAFILAVSIPVTALAAEPTCHADTGRRLTEVVELYTSEGCSSCPPADRWLSGFKADPRTVALAFHVDYWDRLGWKDRFASAAFTERQSRQQAVNGARFSYTPQVVVDGVDRKDWDEARPRPGPGRDATVELSLAKRQDEFVVTVQADPAAPRRLAGYWAVTEQGHVSIVKAGENDGATLHHEFVVRELQPVAAWTPTAGAPTEFRFSPSRPADAAHPRQVDFVVLDADRGRPVQAIKVGC